MFVDAIYTKVREAGAVRSKGLLVALGVNGDGYREILGFMAADTESEGSWGDFFSSHKGLVRAIGKHFQGAACSMCARKSISPRSRRT
ncbi:DNA polymerase IV [Clostridiaceae bacterium JG1575]|nr:DNA polymerase IV [Clostridiaceae bacterium JG1575]